MLFKTRAIVFKYFKYRDTSIIAKIYTEEFGLQSYIIHGIRSARAKGKIALYQPLTLLDLVVYKKNTSAIQRISEVQCRQPLKQIPYQIKKSAIGVFIAEVVYKLLREDEEDKSVFNFLHQSILSLDEAEDNFANFHLLFLIQLSHYLGIGISSVNDFGLFHVKEDAQLIDALIHSEYHSLPNIGIVLRRKCLEELIAFYKYHFNSIHDIKSLAVLKSVLS